MEQNFQQRLAEMRTAVGPYGFSEIAKKAKVSYNTIRNTFNTNKENYSDLTLTQRLVLQTAKEYIDERLENERKVFSHD